MGETVDHDEMLQILGIVVFGVMWIPQSFPPLKSLNGRDIFVGSFVKRNYKGTVFGFWKDLQCHASVRGHQALPPKYSMRWGCVALDKILRRREWDEGFSP